MLKEDTKPKRTPAERKPDLEREAAARGFKPLTKESLASLALGTPEDAVDLLEVSAEVRRQGRARRRAP